MIPDGVETITMTRQDYDRHMENLIIENLRFDERINKARKFIEKQSIEITRLNNIINELEKFLKINSEKDDYDLTEYNKGVNNAYNYTLAYLKDLKENKDEKN